MKGRKCFLYLLKKICGKEALTFEKGFVAGEKTLKSRVCCSE
jgi:hypothetical protein